MRKYYANINLDFDDMKYSIVGDSDTNRQGMIELIKQFAKDINCLCNTKTSRLLDKNGKEIGKYSIQSRDF